MRTTILLLLFSLFLFSNAWSGESLESVIQRLEDADFEIREEASRKLVSDFPAENVKVYLDLAIEMSGKPETATRLKLAAHALFLKKAILQDERYQRLCGDLGFSYSRFYAGYSEQRWGDGPDERDYYPEGSCIGIKVDFTFADTNADKILRRHDVITKINGKKVDEFLDAPLTEYGLVIPGEKYELEVRRCKDIDKVQERGQLLPSDDFEMIKVTLIGEKMDIYYINAEKIQRLKTEAWEAYLAGWVISSAVPDASSEKTDQQQKPPASDQ